MIEYLLIGIVVASVAGFAAWQATTRGRVFVIRIREGVPKLVRGKVSTGFVAEIGDVLSRHRVRRGTIFGVNKRGMVSLGFSNSIPNASRQALRNVWTIHVR
jgi:hypothetical protein